MYERFHIPCVIYAPKIISPQIISEVHSQIDIVPTILQLLNVQTEHSSFGKSVFQKKSSFAFVSEGEMFGWIQDSLFLIAEQEKNIGLYNFKTDANMQRNILSFHPSEVGILRKICYFSAGWYRCTRRKPHLQKIVLRALLHNVPLPFALHSDGAEDFTKKNEQRKFVCRKANEKFLIESALN